MHIFRLIGRNYSPFLSRMCTSQNLDLCNTFRYISSFGLHFIVFLLHGIVAGQPFRKGTNLIFKELKSEIGSGFFQNVTFFESVTLLGLVRISETRAIARKDLSLLTLLFTNEFINLN